MNQASIIQLPGDKRKLVVGLRWRHEDRAPANKALRAAAKERGRWVCRRKTSMGSHQTGFGSLDLTRKPSSLQSLAALVADAKSEPWLGIFELGNGLYWYIAVRDNQEILPDGDVLGNADEIAEARARHASLGEWDYVDGTAADVLRLIATSKRGFPVVDSEVKPWLMPTLGITTFMVTVTAGVMLWQHHQQTLTRQRQAVFARQQALQAAMAARAPKATAILPWSQLSSAASFLDTCGQAFDATPLAQDGWVLSAWDCLQNPGGHGSVDETWTRDGGTDLKTPDGTLSPDGNSISKSHPLPEMTLSGGAILANDPAARAIRGLTQSMGLTLSLSSPATNQPTSRLPGAVVVHTLAQSTDPWAIWAVRIDLPAAPWTFGMQRPSDALPGLRWMHIGWDGKRWLLAGSLYVGQPSATHVVPRYLPPSAAAAVRHNPMPTTPTGIPPGVNHGH